MDIVCTTWIEVPADQVFDPVELSPPQLQDSAWTRLDAGEGGDQAGPLPDPEAVHEDGGLATHICCNAPECPERLGVTRCGYVGPDGRRCALNWGEPVVHHTCRTCAQHVGDRVVCMCCWRYLQERHPYGGLFEDDDLENRRQGAAYFEDVGVEERNGLHLQVRDGTGDLVQETPL